MAKSRKRKEHNKRIKKRKDLNILRSVIKSKMLETAIKNPGSDPFEVRLDEIVDDEVPGKVFEEMTDEDRQWMNADFGTPI